MHRMLWTDWLVLRNLKDSEIRIESPEFKVSWNNFLYLVDSRYSGMPQHFSLGCGYLMSDQWTRMRRDYVLALRLGFHRGIKASVRRYPSREPCESTHYEGPLEPNIHEIHLCGCTSYFFYLRSYSRSYVGSELAVSWNKSSREDLKSSDHKSTEAAKIHGRNDPISQ